MVLFAKKSKMLKYGYLPYASFILVAFQLHLTQKKRLKQENFSNYCKGKYILDLNFKKCRALVEKFQNLFLKKLIFWNHVLWRKRKFYK